jgi:hypothetical protein
MSQLSLRKVARSAAGSSTQRSTDRRSPSPTRSLPGQIHAPAANPTANSPAHHAAIARSLTATPAGGIPASDSWPSLCEASPARPGKAALSAVPPSPRRRSARDIVLGKGVHTSSGSDASNAVPPVPRRADSARAASAWHAPLGDDNFLQLEKGGNAPADDTAHINDAGAHAQLTPADGNEGCNSADAVVDPSTWRAFAGRSKRDVDASDIASVSSCERYSVALPHGLLDDSDGEMSPTHGSCAAGCTDTLSAPSPTRGECADIGGAAGTRSAQLPATSAMDLAAQHQRLMSRSAPLENGFAGQPGYSSLAHLAGTIASSVHSNGSGSQQESPMYNLSPMLHAAESLVSQSINGKASSVSDEDLLCAINAQLHAMQHTAAAHVPQAQALTAAQLSGLAPAPVQQQLNGSHVPPNELLMRKVALLQQVCAQQAQKQEPSDRGVPHQQQYQQQQTQQQEQQQQQPSHLQMLPQPHVQDTPPPRDLQLLQQLLLQQVAKQQTAQPCGKPNGHSQHAAQRYGHRAIYAPANYNARGAAPYMAPAPRAGGPSAMTSAMQFASSGYQGSRNPYTASQQAHMYKPVWHPAQRRNASAQYERSYTNMPTQYGHTSGYDQSVYTAQHGVEHGYAYGASSVAVSAAMGRQYRHEPAPSAQQVEHDAARAAVHAKMAVMCFTQRASADSHRYDPAALWGTQQPPPQQQQHLAPTQPPQQSHMVHHAAHRY